MLTIRRLDNHEVADVFREGERMLAKAECWVEYAPLDHEDDEIEPEVDHAEGV